MKESIYIETSILGHLTARATDNLILAANIKITQDWWNENRSLFILYASEIVEDEAAKGDPAIASQRLSMLQSLMIKSSASYHKLALNLDMFYQLFVQLMNS
ncbi:hypothetical protein [Nostoc sp.]|uniref:hypothetical protein n=1 Tax=Nostoc sp. TaxID=1180 RepID=UPI002FF4CBDE